ncbi:MAG: glutamine synthetase beta-grasp domain-containing protein, partial [Deltaproteobacteria bacterium]|nr:glutamine synthetase beta-grasp domain-containing protein [Deltaproteobacteria bacterium]
MADKPKSGKTLDERKEYVLKLAKEHDVKFIWLWFTDVLGFLKSVSIGIEELEKALRDGVGFDGSSVEGFTRIDEGDMVAMPDPDTFALLPWMPTEHAATARLFCDILTPEGKPFEGDPRYVLRRNLKKAADLGYIYYVGPELEYFYFKDDKNTEPLDVAGYFDMTTPDAAHSLRRETVLTLEQMGIPVDKSHHEVAESQHEIDMTYT